MSVASRVEVPRILAYGNPKLPGVCNVLQSLARWARTRRMRLGVGADIAHFLNQEEIGADNFIQVYDNARATDLLRRGGPQALLVTLGGDGTIIHGVRHFWPFEAAVMGVSVGSLSFNAAVEPDELTESLDAWTVGRATESPRMIISVSLRRGEETLEQSVAINDVVLSKLSQKEGARLIHLKIRQGGELVSAYGADGVIVATPTGSTAYSLSAGGPIVHPATEVLIVSAICPHTLATRPVVLPPRPPLAMEFIPHHGPREAVVWIDGQQSWPVQPGDLISIERAEQPLRLLMGADAPYFSRLREKLSWSGELKVLDREDCGPDDQPGF